MFKTKTKIKRIYGHVPQSINSAPVPPRASVDNVDHPSHYTRHPSGVECIQITEHMGFNLGNAIKYVWRADLKEKAIEDLKKARWYLDREIDLREGQSDDEDSVGGWHDGDDAIRPDNGPDLYMTDTNRHKKAGVDG